MWKLTGFPKTQRVTKALANKFAEMEAAPQDRPLPEVRLKVYEKIIKEGGFRPCSWAAAQCKQTGATYRVNGKHTSTLMSGMEPLPELYAVIEYYECDTLEEVARLYSTYDSSQQSRTVSDINRSFAACVPQLLGVDQQTLNRCASAVWFADRLERYKELRAAERAEGLLEHWDFVRWVADLVGSGHNTHHHLKRMPVTAAMFGCYRKSKPAATEFWGEVRDETGSQPGVPSRKLAKFLLLADTRRDAVASTRRRIKDREFFVKSLHAWNAWRNGETTSLAYFPDAKVPTFK